MFVDCVYNLFLYVLYINFSVPQTFWADVRCEMVDEKGLEPESADMIGQYVQLSGKNQALSCS